MNGDPIVAVFPSRVILTKALDRIMELEYLDVRHAAIIAKARDGEIVILDDDISPNEGVFINPFLNSTNLSSCIAFLASRKRSWIKKD